MSYLQSRDHFTPRQLEVMLGVLENGSQQYLIDSNEPTCDVFTFENDMVSTKARIEAVKKDEMGDYTFPPLPDVSMRIKDTDDDLSCIPISGSDGFYETMITACDDIVPAFLDDINLEIGRCVDNPCEQLRASNGVSTFDIIRIRKHILGWQGFELKKPYDWIAADVNNNGTITTADLLKIRKVVLGVDTEFENVPAWRFLPIYALDSQWDFEFDFEDNPFTATWNINGEQRAYLSDGTNKSYLDKINLNLLNDDVTLEDTWSFRAIKSGDVTFNADIIDSGVIPDDPNNVLTGLPHTCIISGDKFTVSFKTKGTKWSDLEGYQLGLGIQSDKAIITGVNAGDLSGFTLNNFNMDKLGAAEVRTLWYNEENNPVDLVEGTILFKLQLTATAAFCDVSAIFEFDNSLLQNAMYASGGKSGSVEVELELITGGRKHSLKNVYPNPSSSQLSFDFELDEAAAVKIMLWDQAGGYKEETQQYSAGEHTFILTNTNPLQSGALNYTILLGDEINTGNLMKM